MSYLDQIYEDIKDRGIFMVGFGNTGSGKTTTFCQAPKTLLIQCRDNSSDILKRSGGLPGSLKVFTSPDYASTVGLLNELVGNPGHGYQYVTIDGMSGIDHWVNQITVDTYFADKPGSFSAWGGREGEEKSAVEFHPFIDAIESLLASGVNVNLIAHAATKSIKNAQGEDYIRQVPLIGNGTTRLAAVLKIADAVLYFDQSIAIQDGKASFARRVIRTGVNPSFEAKNRLGLPDVIECGSSPSEAAKSIHKAIKQGRKEN